MSNELAGKRIAFLATDGVEEVELTTPWDALRGAGADVTLVAPSTDDITSVTGDINPSEKYTPDQAVGDADSGDFDALVLPGGVANPDTLRVNADAVAFVKAFAVAGKPIAAICHAPWTLVEAGLVKGKTLTSFPSVQTDIRNAGGTWVDEESVTCEKQGFSLVTSRDPDDLDAFTGAAIVAFGAP